jgi:hypothetical protein
MAFCPDCGTPLNAGDRFCGSCGHALLASPSAAVPSAQPVPSPQISNPTPNYSQPVYNPAPPKELIFGAIPVIHKKSIFSVESYHVIVTERRLIMALLTNEMVKEAAKNEGKEGFWSGMVGVMTLGYTYYKKYLNLDPEIALKETPQNYQIDRGQISRLRFQEGRKRRDPQKKIDVYDNAKLEIETQGVKHSFEIVHHFQDMASDVLGRSRLI